MAWAAGNFTRANGANEWQDDAALGIGIEPGVHDAQDNDLATGIDQCLNKTGQNSMTGNLNMGANEIRNASKIGVGTSAPSSDVTIARGSGVSATLALQSNGNTSANEFVLVQATDGATAFVYNRANGPMIFGTNNLTRMQIESTGYVGIGNTSPAVLVDAARNANDTLTKIRLHNANAGSSASTHLDLGNDQNASGSGLFINSSTNTANGGVNCLHLHNGVGPISARVSGSEKIRLDTNNDVILRNGQLFFDSILSSGAGSHFVKWNSTNGLVTYDSSSALIKEQVVDCPYGLNAVAAMQPRKYYRKDDKRHEVGFIADELIAVAPELVSVGAKSLVTGDAADTEQVPVSVSYEKLTAILCKAIQELSAKVEALEAQVQTLQPDTVLG